MLVFKKNYAMLGGCMDKKMKILIVDDFSTMRRIIKNLLRDVGFNDTTEADDGQTALPLLKTGKFIHMRIRYKI